MHPTAAAPAAHPFGQLLQLADRAEQASARPPCADGLSLTDRLLILVADLGPISTAELARRSGLHTREVWGLLKTRRARGEVLHQDGAWELAEADATAATRATQATTQPDPALTAARAALCDALELVDSLLRDSHLPAGRAAAVRRHAQVLRRDGGV